MENKILNKPFKSNVKNKKFSVYVKDSSNKIHKINFGDTRYRNNYSKKAWRSYMARSAGIRDKQGNLTKNNKLSANYWSRRILWKGRTSWKK